MPTTFANTINSNPIYADRAEKDAAGNTISTTYATKAELPTVPVTDVEVDGASVVNQGVAEITMPTVDQTYDSASSNAQSGVAMAGALASKQDTISAGNGIDITNNVVSADLDGTSLTNSANGLSVTLPVPDTTGASQGDVLSVGQSGIEWTTPSSGGGNVFMATSTTTFPELWQAFHEDGKIVYCTSGSASSLSTPYFLQTLKANDSSHTTGTATFVQFNRYSTGRIEAYHSTVTFNSNHPTLGTVTFTRQTIVPDNPSSHAGEFLSANSSGNMVFASISQVPASTSADENKVLTVNSSGNAEWTTPSGGGSVTDVEVNGTSVVNASGVAEVTVPAQVQPDWDATSGLGEILHKPVIPAAQVNADWDATSGVAEILNKPTIPSVDQTYDATSANAQSGVAVASAIASAGLFEALYGTTTYAEIVSAIAAKKIVYCRIEPYDYTTSRMAILTYIGSGTVEFQYYRSANPASAGDPNDTVYIYTVTSSGWSTTSRNVQKSADWNAASGPTSILNKPTIPAAQVNADWDATSGIAEILNKPTIPAAQVNSDWNASSGVAEILNKPTILPYKPVVAGTGVRIVDDTANNRIVVEADETVLWESQDSVGHQTVTLSESKANFERIKILVAANNGTTYGLFHEIPSNIANFNVIRGKGTTNVWMSWIRLEFTNDTTLTVVSAKSFNFGAQTATSWVNPSVQVSSTEDIQAIWKVVGVNRVASN